MSFIPPISKGEFKHLFQRCIPPTGWPKTLAVANSGGPDSTCLLYLLSTLIKDHTHQSGLPQELTSIHVNHDLQDLSTAMEDRATGTATQLGVKSLVVKIPWADKPRSAFPLRPKPGEPYEAIARDARLNRLFYGMSTLGAKCIAFGHHADDQIETSVMRLAHGSSELGAMGMRPVRRWGMGGDNRLSWAGAPGMERFIVRPFLEVSKDRILATCEANGLEYVTDPTNFQPEVTLRNYVRRILDGLGEDQPEVDNPHPLAKEPHKILDATKEIGSPLHSTLQPIEKEKLREAVRQMGQNVEMIDTRVTNFLRQNLIPSPPSTMLITSEAFHTIHDPAVRTALVRRILRYVSPRAWGSLKAEANGNRGSFEKIISNIYDSFNERSQFSGGGNVLWSCVTIRPDGKVRLRRSSDEPTGESAFLIRREPPWDPERLRKAKKNDPLTADVTQLIQARLADPEVVRSIFGTLYDGRFSVAFDLEKMPEFVESALEAEIEGSRIMVVSADPSFFVPRVVLRRYGMEDVVLGEMKWYNQSAQEQWSPWEEFDQGDGWVKIRPIRTWEAI